MPYISSSTWNALGLSVAATFAVLGSSALVDSRRTAELFGLQPWANNNDEEKPSTAGTGPGVIGILVGTRDLTMATALFALHRAGQTDAMGTVILSSMVICAADIYLVWREKKWVESTMFTVGAAIWAAIGLGLRGYFD
ncbi:hypothetical protein TARUN_1242 [Trichoderma arundinaceum]|uniref:Uncharacterized protein n=1 Tax=Trichoderma arundinaceum TaxID=490622 RepID=A0A395NYT9_TRIAR|nr:hypothetical protein TARUN_1242 [Trichoderma arundinaceum]